ncbi:TonB-dependent receptor [Flavobacteriales bacterium]|nr:TonB-dependent receptor [Flavobacteriales bacterium]
MKKILFVVISFFFSLIMYSQSINGVVSDGDNPIPFANISLSQNDNLIVVSSDKDGKYFVEGIKKGLVFIEVSRLGRKSIIIEYNIDKNLNTVDVLMGEDVYNIDQVVVTGTRTFKRKTKSAVIVNVIDKTKIQQVQACNISEALNFQSGLRVETDCQTCNYTQLRMNGLGGGYSQVLINGRAIFSPLTGLYGMEQVPSNMIDRIEIIRGGGSSLYGSSAVGGVVNLITKTPTKNNFEFGVSARQINKEASDNIIFGNGTFLSDNKKSGATFYLNNRNRNFYDHNGDNFSELPKLKDNTFGANFFFLPRNNHKIELNFGSLYEYRYGGEMISGAPHFAMMSEERVHDVLVANIDYTINFNNDLSSFVVYIAAQKTDREHYTGIRPEVGTSEDQVHLASPPYGNSLSKTSQLGIQLNHKLNNFIGPNILTIGSEYVLDYVNDEIISYNYLIDQNITTKALFFQSDWSLSDEISLLSGVRIDKHSLLENIVASPRLSLLYNLRANSQIRISYSSGFRAPQAFDTDLHIAFAGGGISRISLADDLREEISNSFSGSYNYDFARKRYVYGITLEGFYTYLDKAFYQDLNGSDEFGDLYVKRNGSGALVKGLSFEIRGNYNKIIQLETGYTLQSSKYNSTVVYSDGLAPKDDFLRTPSFYGYSTLSLNFNKKLDISLNHIYTGQMDLIHMGGAINQAFDEYVTSKVFNQYDFNVNYKQFFNNVGVGVKYSVGIKNITNSYQNDFDIMKDRDSNFIYGPSVPRMILFGVSLFSI